MGPLPPESIVLPPLGSSPALAAALEPLGLLTIVAVLVTLCVLIAGLISERRVAASTSSTGQPRQTAPGASASVRSAA
jgi:hypothetical protein